MKDVEVYLATAEVATALICDGVVGDRWEESSSLPGMNVSGLSGHLARSILLVESFLDGDATNAPALSVVEYYLAGDNPTDLDSYANRRVRETGEQTAAGGWSSLVNDVRDSLRRLRTRLPDEDLDTARPWFGDAAASAQTVLQARTLEMVVHVDDLADSVGVPTPELPPDALALSIGILIEMARRRHGDLAVLRALARRERDHDQALRVF